MAFQVIATTHSTQITSKTPLSSFVVFTNKAGSAPLITAPSQAEGLTLEDQQDLQRYLDATKANLLFARRIMLVEGAAELMLLPVLIKKVLGLDLEREGISIIAIHGTHFGPFTRLFSDAAMPKRCAIVADADLDASEIPDGDDPAENPRLSMLQGRHVKAFVGATTFEREITLQGNLEMLIAATTDLHAPRVTHDLAAQKLLSGTLPDELKDKVLRTANRFGKARFAQVVARHAQLAQALPSYVVEAVAWLREI